MGSIVSAVAGPVLGLIGANQAASSQTQAANIAAAGSTEAAQIAADAAKFRPYNVRTALGGATFRDGAVDIEYSPFATSLRNRLFDLAQTQLPTDIAAAEAAEYQKLRTAAQPALEQQTSQLGTSLFRTGRQGLDIYGANPELRAFNQALIDRETALQEQAKANVANRIAQSAGLFQTGYGVEQAALEPINIGAGLGGRAATAGAAGASALLQGGLAAAQAQQKAAQNVGLLQGQAWSNLGQTINQRAQQPGGLFGNASIFGAPAWAQQDMAQGYGYSTSWGE